MAKYNELKTDAEYRRAKRNRKMLDIALALVCAPVVLGVFWVVTVILFSL